MLSKFSKKLKCCQNFQKRMKIDKTFEEGVCKGEQLKSVISLKWFLCDVISPPPCYCSNMKHRPCDAIFSGKCVSSSMHIFRIQYHFGTSSPQKCIFDFDTFFLKNFVSQVMRFLRADRRKCVSFSLSVWCRFWNLYRCRYTHRR
jgi:hypothetical protein